GDSRSRQGHDSSGESGNSSSQARQGPATSASPHCTGDCRRQRRKEGMVQEAVPVTKRFGTRDREVTPARVPSSTSIEGSATASFGSTPNRDDSTKEPVIPDEPSSEIAASMRGRFVMPGSRRERVVMPASLRERVIEQIEPSVAATVSRD